MNSRIASGAASSHKAQGVLAPASRLKGMIRTLRVALTALRTRRETIEALRALSDRELADIGLTRGGIVQAALPSAVPAAAKGRAAPPELRMTGRPARV